MTKYQHAQYAATLPEVRRMRDSVAGQAAIKRAGQAYLPAPCSDEDDPAAAVKRYDALKLYAEYDNVPSNTLDTLTGAMFRVDATAQLGGLDERLLDDADGNGVGLLELIEVTAAECLQMRYHGILVEYNGLAGVDPSEVTVEMKQSQDLRAVIKQYQREDIINWSYRVINGAKKLNVVVLTQCETQLDDELKETEVKSLLKLALDSDGAYYQQRLVGDSGTWSEKVYPLAAGQRLREIPFEIVLSSTRNTGSVPAQLGYLDPISAKSIQRYQVSALLKEALRITAQPTSWSKGWTPTSLQQYRNATGRTHVSLGSGEHIPLFGAAEVGYLTWEADSNALFKYMDDNKKQIIALGGVFNEETDSASTATAASINSAEKKGVLSGLAASIERSYGRALYWVGQFEGIPTDQDVGVALTREFVAATLDATQRSAILGEVREGLYSRAEGRRQLERGGVSTRTAEELTDELETNGGV